MEMVAPTLQEKKDFYSFSRARLAMFLAERLAAPKYLADQLFQWVYRHGVVDFEMMTNLSKRQREQLAEVFFFSEATTVTRQISSDGTRKYLFEVQPGVQVESVMIKQPTRMTLCVSSQYGCGMACAFCKTGTMGFQGNLSTSDIIKQVLAVIKDAKNFGDGFTNIVFMGMGEPLHNFNNVAEALRILTDDLGLSIAPRKITVSTVGLVPAIKKFFAAKLGVNLAVSLNATTDEVRDQIMPVNQRFKIAELLETLRSADLGKRRKITIEYVMLAGVNDSEADMRRLVKLLRGMPVKVNLIPYNSNAELGFNTPSKNWVHECHNFLNNSGLDSTIRWSKGQDINAACGQLVSKARPKADRKALFAIIDEVEKQACAI